MKVFPYRTNGYYSALYYQQNYNYPAIFPNSPNRDTNLAMYGYSHIPLTADSVVNVYDFMLEGVPSGHKTSDWIVKATDVWDYTVEGKLSFTGVEIISGEKPGFKVYPNPTTNLLNIELEEKMEATSVKILDVFGKLILTKKMKKNGDYIDVSKLPSGVYFASLNGKTIKFIKD